jgi:hypothetical protein
MGRSVAPIRPRLRTDAYVIPTARGARIHTNRGFESFIGATIHSWIGRLEPYLDGKTVVSEMIRGLPADKQRMVELLVAALFDCGVVRDGGDCHALPEIAFLDSFVPDAALSYQDFHSARLVATGSGPVFVEVLQALADAGAHPVSTVSMAHDRHDSVDGLATALAGGADVALYVPDRLRPAETLRVDQTCREGRVPLVVAVPTGPELWIHAGAGWAAAWRRGHRWTGTATGESLTAAPEAVTLAANMVAMTAFRLVTRAFDTGDAADPQEEDQPAASTIICVDLRSLASSVHRVLPWSSSRTVPDRQSFMDYVAQLAAQQPLDPRELDASGTQLIDPRFGVLGGVSERDYVQLPLNVAAVTVPGRARPVAGAGLSVARARWDAILRGVATYAASTVDLDRLCGGRTWGLRLADGAPILVDASAVFTAPTVKPAGPAWADGEPVGVAATYSWSEAVTAGLLDSCAHLVATRASHVVRLDPAFVLDVENPSDETAAYLRMLRILALPFEVYDVKGPLPLPTFAFQARTRTVGIASGLTPADALPAGLRAILLDDQAGRNAQPEYAPRRVPQLAPTAQNAKAWPLQCTQRELVAALLANRVDPVVVPLDHDPELHRQLPFIVRVVLLDA